MARLSEHHTTLTDGVGKCSVPMWSGGCPDGFCDEPAYGNYIEGATFRDGYTGEVRRTDGKWLGYATGLCCPRHSGPKPDTASTPKRESNGL